MTSFEIGVSSSIAGAKIGPIFREEGIEGHVLYSYRGRRMGIEIGPDCVVFEDPAENEELYAHMDWERAAPYRVASARRLVRRRPRAARSGSREARAA